MELILKETIDTLGEVGDIVKVKAGYARNYLVPRNMAVPATKSNLSELKQQKAAIETSKEKQRKESEGLAKKISGTTIIIEARVGGEDRLFGSITASDIAEKLGEFGINVDKRKILLDEPIKTVGETRVTIKVGYQLDSEIRVQVVPKAAEG